MHASGTVTLELELLRFRADWLAAVASSPPWAGNRGALGAGSGKQDMRYAPRFADHPSSSSGSAPCNRPEELSLSERNAVAGREGQPLQRRFSEARHLHAAPGASAPVSHILHACNVWASAFAARAVHAAPHTSPSPCRLRGHALVL